MGRPRGIPPVLVPAVLEQAGLGRSSREIAAWLGVEHGVKVSFPTVARLLREAREERADVAKAVVREKLQKDLPADLDELEELRKRARAIEQASAQSPRDALKAIEAQRRIIDTKLHYSGADAPDATPTHDARGALLERMRRLAGDPT